MADVNDDSGWKEVDVTDGLPIEADDEIELDDLVDDEDDREDEGADPFESSNSSAEDSDEIALDESPSSLSSNLKDADGNPGDRKADADRNKSVDDDCPITPKTILEAILFVGTPDNRPIRADEIAALMRGVRPDEVDELILELNEEYDEHESAWIVESEAGGYRLALRREFDAVRNRFYGKIKDARLSQAAVDVLAIIAYRQPISRSDIEKLRSKSTAGLINQLLRRQLIRIRDPSLKSRQQQFETTERFLSIFGIEKLAELPQSLDD